MAHIENSGERGFPSNSQSTYTTPNSLTAGDIIENNKAMFSALAEVLQTNLTSNDNLFSLSNLHSSIILPASLFFGENFTLPHFLKNKQNSNPHQFCKAEVGEGMIQLLLIKTTCLLYLLLKNDPLIIKALNFKFQI